MLNLKYSGDVAATTVVADVVTPTSGKRVLITKFVADAAFSQSVVCKLVWKYNHATETAVTIWTIKGQSQMPFQHQIDASDVDGVRKLAVVCDNGLNDTISLSAYAEYKED